MGDENKGINQRTMVVVQLATARTCYYLDP